MRVTEIKQQACPQQRKRDVVGKKEGVKVDERQRDHCPDENHGAGARQRGTEPPRGIAGERSGQDFNQGITRGNPRLACQRLSWTDLGQAPPAGMDRYGMADAELVLFHLALRRF